MIIGFSNGDFFPLYVNYYQRFSPEFIIHFQAQKKANAIELACADEETLDFLLDSKCRLDLSAFVFVSCHVPAGEYFDNEISHRILGKLELLEKKYKIKNFVFHPDNIFEWNIFKKYKRLPLSLENMDANKKFGAQIDDLEPIISKFDFGLTLDLQHCFTVDKSMELAIQFQKEFKNKIIEYHLSGFKSDILHYPLFKTKQDEIINSLLFKKIPIIIESSFEKIGEQNQELNYVRRQFHVKSKIKKP